MHHFDSGVVQTDSRAAGEHILPSAHLAQHASSRRKARALLVPDRGHANPHGLPSWPEAEPGLPCRSPQRASRVETAAAWFRSYPMNAAIWSGCNTDTALILIKPFIGAAKHSCSPRPATHTVLRAPRLRPGGEAKKPSGKMK